MPIALTLTDAEVSNGILTLFGSVAFSGAYPTGGDTMNIQSLAGTQSAQGIGLDSTQLPFAVYIESLNGGYGTGSTAKTGGYYVPVKGTTLANWLLQLFDAGGSERAAATYPAGVLADIVRFEMRFRRPQ